jgi:hypothetical protein
MLDIAIKIHKPSGLLKTHKMHEINGTKAPRCLYVSTFFTAPASTFGGAECMTVQPSRPTCNHDMSIVGMDGVAAIGNDEASPLQWRAKCIFAAQRWYVGSLS